MAMLENGVAPWQKRWEGVAIPFDPTSEKPYRGGNSVYLMVTALSRGYEDPRWITYRQAAGQGWQVRKGERGGQQGQSGKLPWTEVFESLDQWLEWMVGDHEDYTYGEHDDDV